MSSSIPKRSSRPRALAARKEAAAAAAESSASRPAQAATGRGAEIPPASRRCCCPDAGGQDPVQEDAEEASGASEVHVPPVAAVGDSLGRAVQPSRAPQSRIAPVLLDGSPVQEGSGGGKEGGQRLPGGRG